MIQVKISDLKSGLSGYLHEVRRGEVIVVMDRKTPVARLVPYAPGPGPGALVIRYPKPGAPKLEDVPMPPPLGREVDIMGALDEERRDWEP
ncbi:MAG: type II toxin-antitoxin system prevent-host-death family antitoxin [Candidatus Eisenbacteria bacterium]